MKALRDFLLDCWEPWIFSSVQFKDLWCENVGVNKKQVYYYKFTLLTLGLYKPVPYPPIRRAERGILQVLLTPTYLNL